MKSTLKHKILNEDLFSKSRKILYLFWTQVFSSYLRDLKENDLGITACEFTKAMKTGY